MGRKKIALIGGGNIGGMLAFLIAQRELGDAIILEIPGKETVAKGKALDIMESTPHLNVDCKLVGTSSYDDIIGADVVVVTAGLPRKSGMSREDLLDVNLNIISSVATHVREKTPNAFCIILTNPIDAMVYAFKQISGFHKSKVVGMAGVLDAGRFKAFVAMELGISIEDISATILGSHGTTMVPLPRTCMVGGVPLTELLPDDTIAAIVERTRNAGTEIVQLFGTGSAFISPAASAIEMVEAYLKDKRRIMPVEAFLEGEYGIHGYYFGVPAIIGAGGVEKIIELQLTHQENEAMMNSLEAVKKIVAEINL